MVDRRFRSACSQPRIFVVVPKRLNALYARAAQWLTASLIFYHVLRVCSDEQDL